jgi:hypothetical protein
MFGNRVHRKGSPEAGAVQKKPLPGSGVSISSQGHREFRYFLTATVVITMVAASIEGGIHPLLLIPAIPLLLVALLRKDYSKALIFSERVITGLLLAYLVFAAVAMQAALGGFSLPMFLAYFTAGTILARAVASLTDRNLAQLIFLTLGLIIVNCTLTNHMLFGVLLPLYLFALMGTLFLFQLARNGCAPEALSESTPERSEPRKWYFRIATYALLIVVFAISAFALLPRPFLMIPGFRTAMAAGGGFADLQKRISYRDMASMEGRQRIAFAVTMEQGTLPDTPYWRGRVLDKNDTRGWQPSPEKRAIRHFVPSRTARKVSYRVFPHRLQSNVVYVAGLPLTVLGRMGRMLDINAEGEVSISSPFQYSDSYAIRAVLQPIPIVPGSEAAYLDRTGITPAIASLAEQWTSGKTLARDKAAAIMAQLRSQFKYKLQTPPAPEDVHPVEHFLFTTRTGNCEYFAGALCLMLRAVGVPSRVVEGFAGREKTEDPNQVLVRFSMAHAWVEANLGGPAWATLDPTPDFGAESLEDVLWRFLADLYYRAEYQWIRQVVHFDRTDQELLLRRARAFLSPTSPTGWLRVPWMQQVGMGLLMAGIAVVLIKVGLRIRRNRHDPSAIYLNTMQQFVRSGALEKVEPWHETNTDLIVRRMPTARAPLMAFMDVYLRARFDPGERVSSRELREARRALIDQLREAHAEH